MLDPANVVGDLDFKGNTTIRETIYKAIKQAIIDGKLSVGERIVEKTFAQAFSVSRTPVREALRRLETEGHVEYIPRTGVVVSGISKNDVIEVYKIRKALEALVLEQAIANMNAMHAKKLKEVIQTSRESAEHQQVQSIVQNYRSFHDALMEVAEMPRTNAVLGQIKEYVLKFRKISAGHPNRRFRAIDEHEMILNAMLENDLKEAVRLNNLHLDDSLNLIISEMF